MSSGQLPREPRFFPRMKYRAAKRHERAAFGGQCGGLWIIDESHQLYGVFVAAMARVSPVAERADVPE